ncbi:P-loop containing nucleoside triphosphate hydrolase protein [Endogone sp. FLAS-F59071]|nr:P-loop containing nucleoside triphosphate hydrolase protein [Endogone sp. FLAS-F59071]|eukprot:RUS22177.1 P-loop containing nucleoside triphosphate hydrolase protein [Endogone sp. FLAS-F59071]
MVRKKSQSKRMSAAKRYKIEKKVAEHDRKQRKEAKASGKMRKLKKDPGIPNLWPYKEKLLHQIEEQKRKAEEEKERQKLARQNLHNKNRLRSVSESRKLADMVKDAARRGKQFEDEVFEDDEDGTYTLKDAALTGEKDNSRKAYYHEFRKVLDNADVILEVLDARDPLGCRAKHIERMIIDSGLNKRVILILNKIDLVSRENVEEWLKYLRNEYPTIAFKSSTQIQRKNLSQSMIPAEIAPDDILNSSECLGADSLIHLLKNYSRSQNLKTSITVGVIGYPNVGKSSVINSLKRSKVCGVGSTPGLTKVAQQIHLDKGIKLLDCPGIVFAKQGNGDVEDADLLLRNCIKVELLDDPVTPAGFIVSRCNKDQLMITYNVPMFSDSQEFLVHLARQRGKLKKGGVPDITLAARLILQDWNSGKIRYYTVPPSSTSSHREASIVSSWSAEFSLENLVATDCEALNGLRNRDQFGEGAVVIQARETDGEGDLDVEEMDMDDDEPLDNDDASDEEEDTTLGKVSDSRHITSRSIVELKPKQKKNISRPQTLMTIEEAELNPQFGKDFKKHLKQQHKRARKSTSSVVIANNDDMMDDNDRYDLAKYFSEKLPDEDSEDEGSALEKVEDL